MHCPVLVSILLTSSITLAQTEGARISGRVTDLSGAVIVGAECKITNIETNVSTTTTTNQDGIYVIPDLRPGHYLLTVQKDGFRTVIQRACSCTYRTRSTKISRLRSAHRQKV